MSPRKTRTVGAALATAVVTSALAVGINLATEWKTSQWAWAAVAVLTLLTAGLTHLAGRSNDAIDTAEPLKPGVRVSRSVLGTTSNSTIVTGDNNYVEQ